MILAAMEKSAQYILCWCGKEFWMTEILYGGSITMILHQFLDTESKHIY